MAKRKLMQFKEVANFKNCFSLLYDQFAEGTFALKGKWNTDYFKNDNPIVLELGCGKGEYSVGLAKRYPNKNFIGIDIKGNRIWTGAKQALEGELDNVAFLRTRIDFIEACFEENEVSEIWITFPDPQPLKTTIRQRLTNMIFLNRYKKVLKKEGSVNLKTDNEPFYLYTREVVQENKFKELDFTNDLYGDVVEREEYLTSIKTYYEKKFSDLGFKICYLKFKF